LFEQTVSKPRLELLSSLGNSGLLSGFYLAGGTAAALQIGHRRSVDFDFFAPDFNLDQITHRLQDSFHLEVTSSAAGTLHGMIGQTKVSLFQYQLPLLYPTVTYRSVQIAALVDIALMKLVAIANRGSNKDFVDLYFICKKEITLGRLIIELFPLKFGDKAYSQYHLIRSLGYFDDAEKEPPLDMLLDLNWEEVKKFFTNEAINIAQKIIPQEPTDL
jgi:hypothetical protein